MTGNRNLSSGGSVGRRSTISYEAKSSSNEKTNITGDLGTPRYAEILLLSLSFSLPFVCITKIVYFRLAHVSGVFHTIKF